MKHLTKKVFGQTLLLGIINLSLGSSLLAEYYNTNGMERTLQYKDSREKKVLRTNISLYRNQKKIALGTIVDSRGLLLTKASASVGAKYGISSCGEKFSVRIRKRDESTDLALLQIIDSSHFLAYRGMEPRKQSDNRRLLGLYLLMKTCSICI